MTNSPANLPVATRELVSARRQLSGSPDELWTRISIELYKDGADAVFQALVGWERGGS